MAERLVWDENVLRHEAPLFGVEIVDIPLDEGAQFNLDDIEKESARLLDPERKLYTPSLKLILGISKYFTARKRNGMPRYRIPTHVAYEFGQQLDTLDDEESLTCAVRIYNKKDEHLAQRNLFYQRKDIKHVQGVHSVVSRSCVSETILDNVYREVAAIPNADDAVWADTRSAIVIAVRRPRMPD